PASPSPLPAPTRRSSALDHPDVALPGAADLGRRPPAGADSAAEQRGLVEGDVLVDLDDGGLVDGDVRGEGAEQAHRADRVAVRGVHPEPVVADGAAAEQSGAVVAEVLQP